jgi:hypothetical protein
LCFALEPDKALRNICRPAYRLRRSAIPPGAPEIPRFSRTLFLSLRENWSASGQGCGQILAGRFHALVALTSNDRAA